MKKHFFKMNKCNMKKSIYLLTIIIHREKGEGNEKVEEERGRKPDIYVLAAYISTLSNVLATQSSPSINLSL